MSQTWSEDWWERRKGRDCEMCAQGRLVDNGFGLRIFAGRYMDAYLQRVDWARGYTVAIWHPRHVAEPTELNDEEAIGYWQELMTVARALEAHFHPAKMNYSTLGNAMPHLHTHIVPRYLTDPAPGRPLPFPAPDHPRRPESEFQVDVDALRSLLWIKNGKGG